MRYLLVLQPTSLLGKGDSRMPLGLPYINGVMRAGGFDIEAINLQYVGDKPFEVLEKVIKERKIDVVLCGGLTFEYQIIKAVFDSARKSNPGIITIGGGGGFSSEPLLFSEMTGVDYAVIGEGEITDCELAHALDNGLDTSGIKGLVIKKEDGYFYTGPRQQIENIDTIPFPSYEGLDLDKYLEGQTVDGWYHGYASFCDNPRIMPMLMSRSCPFMCTFCYHPIGRGYRSRSMDSFFEELEGYIKQYNINAIALVDECFSIDPERVKEFCERIKPYGLYWMCQMRVETYSKELIEIMVDSGCVSACFGLENMSQTILDDMNKKVTVQQMKNALEVAYNHGGGVLSNILFGAETESEETIKETVDWINNNPKYAIALYIMIGVYPGSGYYEHAIKRGLIKDKRKFIEEGCPIINLTTLSDNKFMALRWFASLKSREIQNVGVIISIEKNDKKCINAIMKCPHCGHENHYKGISLQAEYLGILKKMMCRKCHNYSDYVIDENKVKRKWNTTEWIYDRIVGNTNTKLADWIKNENVKTVALYGILFSGLIVDSLREIGVEVCYGIDREAHLYQGKEFPVYFPDNEYTSVDKIIVIAIESFNEIYSIVRKYTQIDVVSLEEVIG